MKLPVDYLKTKTITPGKACDGIAIQSDEEYKVTITGRAILEVKVCWHLWIRAELETVDKQGNEDDAKHDFTMLGLLFYTLT